MSYLSNIVKNGGMIACGDHLGVLVGTDMDATPKGWVFLKLGEATEDQVRNAISAAKLGRKGWPPPEEYKNKKQKRAH